MRTNSAQCLLIGLLSTVPLGAVRAQAIDVRGTVRNAADAPVAGATVTLVHQGLWTTTDTGGIFRIDGSGVRRQVDVRIAGAPHVERGRLLFGVGLTGPVEVVVYDAAGRVCGTLLDAVLGPGAYAVPLPESPPALRVLRVVADGRRWTICHAGVERIQSSGSARPAAAASAVCAGEVDSLTVSKPGYRTARLAVAAYACTVDVVLERVVIVSFSINRGATYVVTPSCSLTVVDSARALASVRFTQQGDSVPAFDAGDSLNSVRSITAGSASVNLLPWVLPLGGGAKRVWAEITWQDSSRRVDTLATSVAIAPWDVRFSVRNAPVAELSWDSVVPTAPASFYYPRLTGPSEAYVTHESQLLYTHVPVMEHYYFGTTVLDFSVSLGGDTTFVDTFEYWLVVADSLGNMDTTAYAANDTVYHWWETGHCGARLAGAGEADSQTVYRYSIDTASAEGRANLLQLGWIYRPARYPEGGTVVPKVDAPEANFRRLAALKQQGPTQRTHDFAAKEFTIVCRFTGKHFGEPRFAFSRRTLPEPGAFRDYATWATYFDFYVPQTQVPSLSVVQDSAGTFLFRVGLQASELWTSVSALSLLVARLPDDYATAGLSGEQVLALLLQQRHDWFPCAVESVPFMVHSVLVDPSGWEAGRYAFVPVASDGWGNSGIGALDRALPRCVITLQ